MDDTLKCYRAVRDAVRKIYPKSLTRNQTRHLNTLISMISGIVGSRSTNLPDIAGKTAVEPYNNQKPANRESRVKRFSRLLAKKTVTQEVYFMPFAAILIAALAHMPLVLAIDGSAVGMKCTALMIGIVYRKRLLPLTWIVRKGKKGHFPEQIHLELLDLVKPLIPTDAQVVLVGDGEFDGVEYQKKAKVMGWKYVSRTAATIKLSTQEHEFDFHEMGQSIQPGEKLASSPRCLLQ